MPIKRFNFVKTNRLSVFQMFFGLEWGTVRDLLNGWKDGQAGWMELHKERKPKSPEQLGYYYAVILPGAVQAFRENEDYSLMFEGRGKRFELELTKENMDLFLKTRYAAMTGKYVDKSEMDMAECSAYEDWCIKWLAKWLDCQIPPADPEWYKKKEAQE